MNPLLLMDGYKTDHRRQYPTGTEQVYANLTPRKSRVEGQEEVVVFGLQYFLHEYLIDQIFDGFFGRPKAEAVDEYRETLDSYLGVGAVPVDHIAELHDLGYLPIKIKALPEGTLCPIQVPMLTIVNTHPRFFWITNQLETLLSACMWGPCTSATTAYQYRMAFNEANSKCGIPADFARFQGHDFSFRGMSSVESARLSGAAHLTSFVGTDTIPAIQFIQRYYQGENGMIGCSVPATEHSVMCMGGQAAEIETYRRLINDVYPSGIVSIVSDTWDFWSLISSGLNALRGDILKRDGKVVIRPDSGDPVKIICGDPEANVCSLEWDGAYSVLWSIFGGETKNGYKFLNPKVGLIYGDSITLERQRQIIDGLMRKGFAPEIVLGIGSYTYQHKTRDTFGFAVKATHGIVNGESRDIFKSPKTDKGGEKKSLCGRLMVDRDASGRIVVTDRVSAAVEDTGLLETVYLNGNITKQYSLADVRRTLHGDQF